MSRQPPQSRSSSRTHLTARDHKHLLRDDAESCAPPSSVDLDSGKAVIRPAQSATSRYDAP
ncbi:DUF6191 domain-containing protein [Streptomyces sp. NPDC047315]|uniref:DUF6191 domain-containing protein n=1 Tax=Streptomyces sp. NPDC047315 TaxID=3155142 RepID=UPI0034085264